MATKEKAKKGGKDSDKKNKKIEDEDKKIEKAATENLGTIDENVIVIEQEVSPQESTQPLPVQEPVIAVSEYEEPVLAELIIESYEGEKVKGLYDGLAVARFKDKHTYEGQFSEGLMHGKGKYTWADGVIYEGDFFRNVVTGKGLYLWPDGSCYEGDVVQGKRHGQGEFRWKDNVMSYSGDWNQGFRHGKGRMSYDVTGKSFYDGDWVMNLRHGWGVRQYASENVYEGMWFNNARHGQGTMKWADKDQIYTGQWENGIQHGLGQHTWILRRVPGSQYSMRNVYDGEFVNGLRHGYGTFHYANGASYSGYWNNNMKHGKGKFLFKNGRIYEGMFEHDHIVEYPDFRMNGTTTPDISGIRTRTPLPSDDVSIQSNESRNTITPNFQLEIDALLSEFPEDDQEEEINHVLVVITRHVSSLRKIYQFYSRLGFEESLDNTFSLSRMQFWRFAKDCHFHHSGKTLMEMDRYIGKCYNKATFELHNPFERILMRQFINCLVLLAYQIYGDQFQDSAPVLANCLSTLITENILRHACNVQGRFFYEPRRSIQALIYVDQSYEIFQYLCHPRKHLPKEPALKMREFLFLMKDLKLMNNDLTPQHVIKVLSSEDPAVVDGDGFYNLELEMTFLEFFEALIGCAEIYATEALVKDPITPRPSTAMTHSVYSVPACPSRVASHAGMEQELGDTNALQTPHDKAASPPFSETPRAPSSNAGTVKTTKGGSAKSKKLPVPATKPTTKAAAAAGAATAATSAATKADKTGVESSNQQDSNRDQAGELTSVSVASGHTNNTEDQQTLMQSLISMGGLRDAGEFEEGLADHAGEGQLDLQCVEEELDPDTRKFNFWTHQVHVFFHMKFLKAAQYFITVKKAVESRRIQEKLLQAFIAKNALSSELESS